MSDTKHPRDRGRGNQAAKECVEPTVTLSTYAHLFDELDGADRTSAENRIRHARRRHFRRNERNACKSCRADARTRTADPFITSEVLYQLSYVGGAGPV